MGRTIEIRRVVSAQPEAVMRVLTDGWQYASWSVGAVHVTQVDPGWPAPGSRVHHGVGLWPVVIRHHTEVVEYEPNRRLLLHPHQWPLGDVEVITVPDRNGTLVRLRYHPGRGRLNRMLQRIISRARGRESLGRLAALSQAQPRGRASSHA